MKYNRKLPPDMNVTISIALQLNDIYESIIRLFVAIHKL